MAKNVTVAGASYTDVPAIELPVTGGGTATFYDAYSVTYSLTNGAYANVTPDSVVAGEGFSVKLKVPSGYNLSNVTVTMGGTDITSSVVSYESSSGSSATLGTKSITANGTYTATDDSLDGYSEVTVNISSWTKIAEKTYTVSTTSTSAATVETWSTGDSSIWDSSKIVYVKIRDSAGKRAGYFYGSDTFFMNYPAVNSSSTTNTASGTIRNIWYYNSSSQFGWRYGYSTTGYGVYADYFYSDGRIRIRQRYNSSYSLTINGTYKVEVYTLNTPDGTSPFA